MSRFRCEMSVNANVVSASSGTARMSRISRRVKPIEPAPIMAILMGMESRIDLIRVAVTITAMSTATIPVSTSDTINARILAISEDKIQGFQPDPIGEIMRQTGLDEATVIERIAAMLRAGTIRRVRQTLMAT